MLDMQDKFELPKNVKQIGRGDNFLKVYMEDYVYTYLKQYAKQGNLKNKYCALVGRIYKNQIEKIVVVKGAIRCNLKNSEEDTTIMSDIVRTQIDEEQKKYYPEYEIVGWMHATDSDIKKIFEYDNLFHRLNFSGNNKILFMMDFENDLEEIHCSRDNTLNKLQGFYVYYDRNKEMQNYMVDNKLENEIGSKNIADFKSRPIIKNTASVNTMRRDSGASANRMVASLSFALLVMCVIMGFGVVKSLQKINDVESKVTVLNDGYVMLQEKVNNSQDTVTTMNNKAEIGNNENSNISEQGTTKLPVPTKSLVPTKTVEPAKKVEPTKTVTPTKPVVPTKTAETPKNTKFTKYVVKKGDSLNKISFIHYKNTNKAKDIMEANKLSSPDKIRVGQELVIPLE